MKKRKIIALFMTIFVLASTLSACGQNAETADVATDNTNSSAEVASEPSGTEPGTFPISEERVDLRIMVPVTPSHSVSLNELDMLKEYSEMTNVYVEWEEVSSTAYDEKYKLVLASNNDLPDAFGPNFNYDGSVIYRYAQEGVIIPLNDLIDSVGVNTKKFFDEREDFKDLSTFPDGNIYGIPAIDENQNIRMSRFFVMNHTFLDTLGIEMPTTLEELEAYLTTATTQDLNGDGQNEIGLSFSDPKKMTVLFSMFGTSWEWNSYLHYTGNDDFTFAPTMDSTREALEYYSDWYAKGLIDPEIFTQDSAQVKAKGTQPGIALGIEATYPALGDGAINEYHIMPPVDGPEGWGLWARDGLIPGYQSNQFMITNVNEHPEETLRYIDYWMDNGENALTVRFGPEDYSWEWLEEENGVWTETATVPTGETRTMELSTLHCPWAHGIPYWCFGDFWSQKNITVDNANERGAAIADWYITVATPGLPSIVYEEADNQEALTIKTDLFKYVDSQIAQFLTNGVTDDTWDEYVEKCEQLGSDRWVELYAQYYNSIYM